VRHAVLGHQLCRPPERLARIDREQIGGYADEEMSHLAVASRVARGEADSIRRLRKIAYDVAVLSPGATLDEDLAAAEEIRRVRPGVKLILLTPTATPEAVIAALRGTTFGEVEVVVHNERIVQITKSEKVRFDGQPSGEMSPHKRVNLGISYVPEGRWVFPSLTVHENLMVGGHSRRTGMWTIDKV